MSQWKTVEQGKIPTSIGLRLEVPKIPSEILDDPNRLNEVVELKMAGVSQIQEGVANALKRLASILLWLALCQPDPEDSAEEKSRKAMRLRISKSMVAEDQEKIYKYLGECLNTEELVYKTAAAISYLNFVFSQEVKSHEAAVAMLADLESKKLLVKASTGPITIGYQRYDVSRDFGLEEGDLQQIQTAVGSFSRSFMALVRYQRQEKTKDLSAESNLTFDQFVGGKEGKFLLEVPAENRGPDPKNPKGKDKWLGGGNLLLEVKGKEVIPLESSGAMEGMVAKLIQLDIRLPHHTLSWDAPPGAAKAFKKVQDGVMANRHLSESNAEIYVRKMQSLWHLVTRGIDAKAGEAKMNEFREFLRENSKLTAEQFFGLNGNEPMEGPAYLEFEGGFKDDNNTFYNVFFLIERSRRENTSCVEVLDAPEHVKELLGKMCFEGKLEEGEDFMKLPHILQRVLRAIRSKTDLHVEIDKAHIEVAKAN